MSVLKTCNTSFIYFCLFKATLSIAVYVIFISSMILFLLFFFNLFTRSFALLRLGKSIEFPLGVLIQTPFNTILYNPLSLFKI